MCTYPGCSRSWIGYLAGTLHGLCDAHELLALRTFGPQRTTSRRSPSVGLESSADRQEVIAVGEMDAD